MFSSRSSIAFALFTSGVYAQTCSDAGVLENPSSTGDFENCVVDSQFCQPDNADPGQGVQQTYTVACQCPPGQWFNSGTDQNYPTLGCMDCVGECTSCQVVDRPTEFEGYCVCDDGYVTNQEAPREPCVEDNTSCPDACPTGCNDVCDAGFGCTAEEDAQDCDTTSGGSADGPDLSEGCIAACQTQYDAVNEAVALCVDDDTTVIPYTDFVTCFNGDGACANDELPIPLEDGMTDENLCQMLMADGPDDCGTDSNGDPIFNCEDGSCPDEIEGCSEDISMSEECGQACGLLWLDVVNALDACEADDTRSTVIPYADFVTCFDGDGTAAAACANDELPIPHMEGMTDDNMCQLFDGADGSGSGGEPTGACALCWENELQSLLNACGCDSVGMNCDETITDTQGTLAAFQTCVQDAEFAEEGSCGEDLQDILETQDSEACAKAADNGSGDSFSGSGSDSSSGSDGPDSCFWANDYTCDEGLDEDDEYYCADGTDTTDCEGSNSCLYAYDGECDAAPWCEEGTDEYDCANAAGSQSQSSESGDMENEFFMECGGARLLELLAAADYELPACLQQCDDDGSSSEICPDTECEDPCDGICDEGGEDALCAPGTDTQDCDAQANCPDTECEDGCDGYCDEGGICEPGTDTTDCAAEEDDDMAEMEEMCTTTLPCVQAGECSNSALGLAVQEVMQCSLGLQCITLSCGDMEEDEVPECLMTGCANEIAAMEEGTPSCGQWKSILSCQAGLTGCSVPSNVLDFFYCNRDAHCEVSPEVVEQLEVQLDLVFFGIDNSDEPAIKTDIATSYSVLEKNVEVEIVNSERRRRVGEVNVKVSIKVEEEAAGTALQESILAAAPTFTTLQESNPTATVPTEVQVQLTKEKVVVANEPKYLAPSGASSVLAGAAIAAFAALF